MDVAPRPDLSGHAETLRYGVRFRGFVEIPKDGTYSFFLRTEGSAEVRVGTTKVGSESYGGLETAMDVALKAGRHAFQLTYLGKGGEKSLEVSWSGPGLAKQALPAKACFR